VSQPAARSRALRTASTLDNRTRMSSLIELGAAHSDLTNRRITTSASNAPIGPDQRRWTDARECTVHES
jgi:hypothetical protein